MAAAARWGFILALILGALSLIAALLNPLALATCLMFIVAATGLWRGWAWCGYGPALWLIAQSVSSMVLAPAGSWKIAAIPAMLALVAAWALFRAGRSLDSGNSQKLGAALWIGVVAANLLWAVMVQPFVIPTGAMEDTIFIGDHIVVPRFGGSQPVRGELITFRYPVDPTQTFVKRVIGVPGDHIRIVNKQAYVNGVALEEPYKTRKTDYVDSYRDNFPSEPNASLAPQGLDMLRNHVINGEMIVPPGSYFVMGDNRDSSLDSRYWGFVPQANIVGVPRFVYWSEDQTKTAWFWFAKTRWDRNLRWLK
jgi:signal peptidase I